VLFKYRKKTRSKRRKPVFRGGVIYGKGARYGRIKVGGGSIMKGGERWCLAMGEGDPPYKNSKTGG